MLRQAVTLMLLVSILVLKTGGANAATFDMYGGGGLSVGQLKLEQLSNASTFHNFSYKLEAGFQSKFSGSFGAILGADYGTGHAYNNTTGENYIENAKTSFYSLKAGIKYLPFTVGTGMRVIDMTIKSVSATSGTIEMKYKGELPLYFFSYTLNSSTGRSDDFQTILMIEQVKGKLDDLLYEDANISLNLIILLGN